MSTKFDLVEELIKKAVEKFWQTRLLATQTQQTKGIVDNGGRSAVTSGKNLDGFVDVIKLIVKQAGLEDACIMTESKLVTLPGFFRPTKKWDILIISKEKLVAALEFKSQVGPSFGNNFNNRCEEAIGTSVDLWTAYREGAFGNSPKPFVGYLILLEDCLATQRPVKESSPHFEVFPEFKNISYSKRYENLCTKLVKENLYTSTAFITSTKEQGVQGKYIEPNAECGIRKFMIELNAHINAAQQINEL